MDKIVESKFMQALQRMGTKLAANKAISSVSGALMGMMAIIMTGAVFQILASVPQALGWVTTTSKYYTVMMMPYNMTMGLLSVFFVFATAYIYSRTKGHNPLMGGVVALALFLIVASPIQAVELADGTTMNVLNTTSLGGVGLFAAILVGLGSVGITQIFKKNKIVIQMPDSVPQSLSDSFTVMLPMVANVVVWYGLDLILDATMGTTLPLAITGILAAPLGALTSVPGILVLCFIACFLWFFGIHGSLIVYTAIMPSMMANAIANAQAVAAGGQAIFYATALFGVIQYAGGTGNTLPLIFFGLRSKSEQLRAISRVGLVPGIFGINEPISFGYPVMYNPVIAIPFIINPIISGILVYLGYMIGFFKPGYISVGGMLPFGVATYLSALAWQNIFIPVVCLVVAFICYYPFFKIYEKQLIERESQAN